MRGEGKNRNRPRRARRDRAFQAADVAASPSAAVACAIIATSARCNFALVPSTPSPDQPNRSFRRSVTVPRLRGSARLPQASRRRRRPFQGRHPAVPPPRRRAATRWPPSAAHEHFASERAKQPNGRFLCFRADLNARRDSGTDHGRRQFRFRRDPNGTAIECCALIGDRDEQFIECRVEDARKERLSAEGVCAKHPRSTRVPPITPTASQCVNREER